MTSVYAYVSRSGFEEAKYPWTFVDCDGLLPMFTAQGCIGWKVTAGPPTVETVDRLQVLGLTALPDVLSSSWRGESLSRLLVQTPLRNPFPFTWIESQDPCSQAPTSRIAVWSIEEPVENGFSLTQGMFILTVCDTNGAMVLEDLGKVQMLIDQDGYVVLESRCISLGTTSALTLQHQIFTIEQIKGQISVSSVWGVFCLQMLCCKNVTVEALPPAVRLSRQQRRAQERAGLPQIQFKTIVIRMRDGRKVPLRSSGDMETVPLHLVRGHFKTYTAERPLFGKVTGTFWCQAHMRGCEEAGTVFHDYEVLP